MWIDRSIGLFVFITVPVLTAKNNENFNNLTDPAIKEVLHNISTVNDVLQNLIDNYNKVQQLMKSDETFENDYSNSNEIYTEVTTKRNNDHIATDVIFSDEVSGDDGFTTNSYNKILSFREESYNGSDKTVLILEEDTSEVQPKTFVVRDGYDSNNQKKEYIGKDIVIKYGSSTEDDFFKKDAYENKMSQFLTQNESNKEQARRMVHLEILQNTDEGVSPVLNSKKHMKPKNAIILGVRNIDEILKTSSDDASASSREVTDDDLSAIKRQVFVLRDKFGLACLRLIIRKCFLSIKDTLKNVRSTYKIRGGMKSLVKSKGKKGCLKEFDITKIKTEKNNTKNANTTNEAGKTSNSDEFDQTRRKLLNCIPTMAVGNSDAISEGDELNLLRTGYDKACSREFRKRCLKVCKSSFNSACKSYSCGRSKKSYFRRNCKLQCRSQFKYEKQYKSKSSDSSSSSRS